MEGHEYEGIRFHIEGADRLRIAFSWQWLSCTALLPHFHARPRISSNERIFLKTQEQPFQHISVYEDVETDALFALYS